MAGSLKYPLIQNTSPEVLIELVGAVSSPKLTAVVDTGFDGFLQVPLAEGIKANLMLWSVGGAKLADGRIVKNLQCFGSVKFGGKTVTGIITLTETGTDCLIGMEFLSGLEMDVSLSIKDKTIEFTDRATPPPAPNPAPVVTPTPAKPTVAAKAPKTRS